MKLNPKAILIGLKSLKFIKLLKAAKFFKLALSMLSMVIFAACYSWQMGVFLACMVTVLLLVHEIGHIWAVYRFGHGLKLPAFIPFLGAVIFAPPMKNRSEEASIGIGGPIVGSLAALLCVFPYFFGGGKVWLAGSLIGVAINLFNLIPLSPMDGGRITQAVSPWCRWLGWAGLVVFTVIVGEPGMLIIWMLVITELRWLRPRIMILMLGAVWFIMAALTFMGYHRDQQVHSNWANYVDVVFGLLIFGLYAIFGWNREAMPDAGCDDRPMPEAKVRWAYAALWVVLVGILFFAVVEIAHIAH